MKAKTNTGLAIDYGLFVLSRFREELAGGREVDDAVRRAMATAGRTVLFSGLTVAAAMASLLIFPQAFLRSMGYGGIVDFGRSHGVCSSPGFSSARLLSSALPPVASLRD